MPARPVVGDRGRGTRRVARRLIASVSTLVCLALLLASGLSAASPSSRGAAALAATVAPLDTSAVDAGNAASARINGTCSCLGVRPQDMCVYYGDLHTHTGYSDGEGTPAQAFQVARSNGLDVLAVTDHARYLDQGEWDDILVQAEAATKDGTFVGLRGFEWTSAYGHINVYGSGEFVAANAPGYDTLEELYAWMADPARTQVVAQFNHPDLPEGAFGDFLYDEAADTRIGLIEISSGTAAQLEKYHLALASGWHVSPSNNSDTHDDNWGLRPARTGILAPDLTRHAMLAALRARRIFSTEDPDLVLAMRAGGSWMGSEVLETPYSFEIYASDPDPGDPVATLEFYQNGDLLASTPLPSSAGPAWKVIPSSLPGYAEPPGGSWWYAKAIQSDGDVAYSGSIYSRARRQYDALVRDNLWDEGAVPSNEPAWQSPDVWVRHERDGRSWHQQPVAGTANYVYARVQNIGTETLKDVDVTFYWSDPALGSAWPDGWSVINDVPVKISDLVPGETRMVSVLWNVPAAAAEGSGLLVRLDSTQDPIRYDGHAQWDNNIAWKNVHIVDLTSRVAGPDGATAAGAGAGIGLTASQDLMFDLVNPYAAAKLADVRVTGDDFPGEAALVLYLAPQLFDRWIASPGGGAVEGGIVDVVNRCITFTHPIDAAVYRLPLLARERWQSVLSLDVPPGSIWAVNVTAEIDGHQTGGMLYLTPTSARPVKVDLAVPARRAEVERSIEVTATVMGEGGVPVVDGIEVSLRTTLGSLDPPVTRTWDGVVTGTLHTGPITGTAFVQAGIAGTVTDTISMAIEETEIAGLAFDSSMPDTLGQTTYFTASVAAGTHVTYSWAFGDGGAGSGQTTRHRYGAVGRYTVTLTGTNPLGSEVLSGTVVVEDVPIAGLALVSTSPDWVGQTTYFTASVVSGTNVAYTWSFGDGATGSGSTVAHDYTRAGNYTVTLTATNSAGSVATSGSVIVRDEHHIYLPLVLR